MSIRGRDHPRGNGINDKIASPTWLQACLLGTPVVTEGPADGNSGDPAQGNFPGLISKWCQSVATFHLAGTLGRQYGDSP